MKAFVSFSVCVPVFAVALTLAASRPVAAQGQSDRDYIVTFSDGVDAPARGRAAAAAGGVTVRVFRGVRAAAVRVPTNAALARLAADPSVLSIVPDRVVSAFQSDVAAKAKGGKSGRGGGGGGGGGGGETPPPPPPPSTSTQVTPAGVVRVGMPTTSSNGSGIGVAVLDTGVDLTHADLTGTVNAFSTYGSSCRDDNGHGTHVAGIVGARNNTVGVVGVAPAAGLYCVKVLDASGYGSDATLMAGLDWVLDVHAAVTPAIRVVNMSLGRPGFAGDNPAMHDLIIALERAGVAVVVAAGNNATVDVSQMVPASYPEVIAVASTTAVTGTNGCTSVSAIAADTASYFTTDGVGVAISAPGEESESISTACGISTVGILSTQLGGGTVRMSGTSMAAPHVTGVVARYFQQAPASSVAYIRQYLQDNAARAGTAPLNSPTSTYTFDGLREGIAKAP